MSVDGSTSLTTQPGGADPSDTADVVTRYVRAHPMNAATMLTHQDTNAIVYLTEALDIELLSFPAEAFLLSPGALRFVGILGGTVEAESPLHVRSLLASSSCSLFLAHYSSSSKFRNLLYRVHDPSRSFDLANIVPLERVCVSLNMDSRSSIS